MGSEMCIRDSAGTFNTPEEAALQIAAYETKLAEGMDPWDGAEIRSQHKRGQVWRSILVLRCSRIPVCLNHRAPHLQAPPMRTGRRRKVGKKSSLSGSEGREHTVRMATRMRPQAKLQGRITRSCPHASETPPPTVFARIFVIISIFEFSADFHDFLENKLGTPNLGESGERANPCLRAEVSTVYAVAVSYTHLTLPTKA